MKAVKKNMILNILVALGMAFFSVQSFATDKDQSRELDIASMLQVHEELLSLSANSSNNYMAYVAIEEVSPNQPIDHFAERLAQRSLQRLVRTQKDSFTLTRTLSQVEEGLSFSYQAEEGNSEVSEALAESAESSSNEVSGVSTQTVSQSLLSQFSFSFRPVETMARLRYSGEINAEFRIDMLDQKAQLELARSFDQNLELVFQHIEDRQGSSDRLGVRWSF